KLWKSGKVAAGTGLGGRLRVADVLAAASAPESSPAPAGANPPAGPEIPGPHEDQPIRGIRKIIAERMLSSLRNSAQITLNSSAPAARLLAMRARFKATAPENGYSGITIGDLVAYAAVRVLASHPKLNAHVLDGILRSYSQVHLGIAVDTPRGLMVPTIRDAGSLSLREFSARSKKLAADCISGSIAPDLLSGGTFTVTNLGAFGIESFTPVLNEPQTAILGIDAIAPCPTLDSEGSIGAEMRIGFSLTVDHRVVDGADAARYLKDLADFVASIDLALLS
ncbi:MAG TPA: 2-oxo acid dehydrogenase subunit E2, partial [Rectinemataceae bacterium]